MKHHFVSVRISLSVLGVMFFSHVGAQGSSTPTRDRAAAFVFLATGENINRSKHLRPDDDGKNGELQLRYTLPDSVVKRHYQGLENQDEAYFNFICAWVMGENIGSYRRISSAFYGAGDSVVPARTFMSFPSAFRDTFSTEYSRMRLIESILPFKCKYAESDSVVLLLVEDVPGYSPCFDTDMYFSVLGSVVGDFVFQKREVVLIINYRINGAVIYANTFKKDAVDTKDLLGWLRKKMSAKVFMR